jgi:hypothetical protein
MNRVPLMAVVLTLLCVIAVASAAAAQPAAPTPEAPRPLIMGVKTTEPMRVVQRTLTTTPDVIQQDMAAAVKVLADVVKAAHVAVVPGAVRVVLLTPMDQLQAGAVQEMKFAVQLVLIEDVPEGPLNGDADTQVAEVKPLLVAYTYGKGPTQAVPQERAMAVVMWAMGQGYVPIGPVQMIVFEDPAAIDTDDVTLELQLGVKKAD